MPNVEYDNSKILGWSRKNLADIKQTITALGIKHSKYSKHPTPMQDRILLRTRANNSTGMIDKISYKMLRTDVFVHKGVGRGHPITNPRKAKHWFDIPTNINLPELQQIVAEEDVTYVVNNLEIK